MIAPSGPSWVHYREVGRPDGEPLLLVMGLGASGRAWARLLPHLEPHARLLVVDNRGTGDSDRVDGPLTLQAMARDLVAVLDHAELPAAHVLGVSLGGMVAQVLALEHRARVRSLVLGCTTAGGMARLQPPWRLLAANALRPLLGVAATWEVVAPALYSQRTRREAPERVEEDLRLREADATPGATVLAQLAAAALHDVRGRLGELGGLPVTVLHGEEDGVIPAKDGVALAAGIPGARLVMLPSCGHMLTTDAEQATADAVLDHLGAATAA